jgi:hypothetical protein
VVEIGISPLQLEKVKLSDQTSPDVRFFVGRTTVRCGINEAAESTAGAHSSGAVTRTALDERTPANVIGSLGRISGFPICRPLCVSRLSIVPEKRIAVSAGCVLRSMMARDVILSRVPRSSSVVVVEML